MCSAISNHRHQLLVHSARWILDGITLAGGLISDERHWQVSSFHVGALLSALTQARGYA